MSRFLENRFAEFADLAFCDRVACASRKMVDFLHTRRRISLKKLVYLPNGVDLDSFQPVNDKESEALKEQLGLDGKLIFGYIGDVIAPYQGIENFLHAARQVNENEIGFIIVGGTQRLREGNILFIPKVSREQIARYYSICDVLVLPRPRHPIIELMGPTKFAEYAAMGKPILTTEVGEPARLVATYKCGIVVKDNTPGSLIKGVFEFKGMPSSELTRMGKNSRKLAENEFDWNRLIDNLLKAIMSL